MTERKRRSQKSKRPMRSFEAAKDVDQMLDQAMANGIMLKDAANMALRAMLPGLLRDQVKQLRERADEMERKISEGKG